MFSNPANVIDSENSHFFHCRRLLFRVDSALALRFVVLSNIFSLTLSLCVQSLCIYLYRNNSSISVNKSRQSSIFP